MFSNLNINTKTLKILSLVLTVTGILFILASKYIGSIAIRIAMIILISFCIINLKMTYKCVTSKEKINHLIPISASALGFYKPELIMMILGFLILYLSPPTYIKAIKSSDYSDVITLIITGTGILFSIYCILNSNAALNTVIIIIGIIFVITGCLTFYETFTDKNIN